MGPTAVRAVAFAVSFCLLLSSSPVWAAAKEPPIAANVAGFFVGEEKIVEDTVTAAERDGSVVHLHLGKPPQELRVSLIIGLLSTFPAAPEKYYLGKTVRVVGMIHSFRGAPEMDVHDAADIQLAGTSAPPPGMPKALAAPPVATPPAAAVPAAPAAPAPLAAAPPAPAAPEVTAVRLTPEEALLLRRIDELNVRLLELERRVRKLEKRK